MIHHHQSHSLVYLCLSQWLKNTRKKNDRKAFDLFPRSLIYEKINYHIDLYNDRLSTLLRFPLGNCAMGILRAKKQNRQTHVDT